MQDTMERMLIRKAYQNREPVSGSLELLPLCNLDCEMCYVRLTREQVRQKGGLRSTQEWIRIAEQMKEMGTLFVTLTGGEPLLYPGFQKLYLALRDMGMIVTVNTNGTLVNKDWVAFFAENPPRRINVTLYGANEETYRTLCHDQSGFEKACQAVHLLCQAGISVKINGSLVKANAQDIDWLIDFAKEQGAAINIDTYMYPAKRERLCSNVKESRLDAKTAAKQKLYFQSQIMGQEEFQQMAKAFCLLAQTASFSAGERKPMQCQAGKSSFTINWQGQMRPCVMLPEPSLPVLEIGFAEAWRQLCQQTDQIFLNSKCASCEWQEICQTCAACALHESGSIEGVPEYMCAYTRAQLEGYQTIGNKLKK